MERLEVSAVNSTIHTIVLIMKSVFWQAELDLISSENLLKFKTPPFFTVIIRSLTILEGFALSVDPNFRLVSDRS